MKLLNFYRKGYYLPFLSAILLIISFPRCNFGFVAWFSLLPLFFYCLKKKASWKQCFWGGALAGLLFFLYLHAYMSLSVNFLLPPLYGCLVVIIASVYSSFFFALFAAGFSLLLKKGNLYSLSLGAPSLWVLLEKLRSFGLLGHTGGFLGYSQVGYSLIMQNAALYGYWGLAFLMVLFQVIVFLAWQKTGQKLILPSALFILLFLCGMLLPPLFPEAEREEPLRLALFQGNIPQEEILDQTLANRNFRRYLDLSKKAALQESPLDLMVWPETVLSSRVIKNNPTVKDQLAGLAQKTGAAIFFGAIYKENTNIYNSILFQTPGKASWETARYDKIRLVPLAEYFPFSAFINEFLKLNISLGKYTPGAETPVFSLKGSTFGGIVCFESYFPRPALDLARKGAEHIFVLTNNAWFLDSIGLDQHARAAAVRAVETGVGVTQVANTGYTISFNYHGNEVLRMPLQQEGFAILETTFPFRLTLYRLLGDYFLYLCFFFLLLSAGPAFGSSSRNTLRR
ncbi:MAG: apolipoprotein N-acyltransferase [Firmicutes bacterium]|nr:apolipoprotein N-acyltransferase [Bacillota bacterium]